MYHPRNTRYGFSPLNTRDARTLVSIIETLDADRDYVDRWVISRVGWGIAPNVSGSDLVAVLAQAESDWGPVVLHRDGCDVSDVERALRKIGRDDVADAVVTW